MFRNIRMNNKNLNLIQIEKNQFSSLQSEFFKLTNTLSKNINSINSINSKILELENLIKNLRITLNNNSNTQIKNKNNKIELENHTKDLHTIEHFKPYMIYYRMMLDIIDTNNKIEI